MAQHKEQQGFLTFAKNTDTTDYLRLAYAQALSIKATQQHNKYAIIVNSDTEKLVTDAHRLVFDYVIVTESTGTFNDEWKAFWLTPFKETIKLESDILFTTSIDHWWDAFRLREVCLSTGCRNYRQELSNTRKYRKVFDDNDLPDVYNGLMYFRFSKTAKDFYTYARRIFESPTVLQESLSGYNEHEPSTDLVFSVAAKLAGVENCTIPSLDFLNFVHMKPAINGFSDLHKFSDVFVTEFDDGIVRINNINQYHPLHYYDKQFITDEIIGQYVRS